MRPAKRRAHSLIELFIASSLLMLLMTSVVVTLVSCNSYIRHAETKVEAQSQTLAASVWLSRSLSECNVTATCTTAGVAGGVSFPSPRDPASGDVAWGTGSGALVWRQMRFCYLEYGPDNVPQLTMKGFPIIYSGATPTIMWNGFPPFPANGALDLPAPQPVATGMGLPSAIRKTVARNIRRFEIEIYKPTDPPDRANTANMTIEGFAPYYGLNYGVRVRTRVRMRN